MADRGSKLESHDAVTYFTANQTRGDMRQADRNATLKDLTNYIYQSLIDYQGKWEATDISDFTISMPNARYLAVGDLIKNITTGKFYTISSIVDSSTKTITVTGPTAPVVGQVLALQDKNMVNFVSDYSKEYKDKIANTWVDTISFFVKRKEPGTIGKHPFDPPTEIKPRVRECRVDPDYPDHHISILGQWFDVLLQFDCWAKTNNRADDLIAWFEEFVFKYTWVWKKNGVNEILYWMRIKDEQVSKWRNDLAARSILYYFRTETITTIRENDFQQLDLYLELSNILPSGFSGVGYNTIAPSGHNGILDNGFNVYV